MPTLLELFRDPSTIPAPGISAEATAGTYASQIQQALHPTRQVGTRVGDSLFAPEARKLEPATGKQAIADMLRRGQDIIPFLIRQHQITSWHTSAEGNLSVIRLNGNPWSYTGKLTASILSAISEAYQMGNASALSAKEFQRLIRKP